jgi:hypothetical protein
MTFVGKILVTIIMVFALFFLAVSTMVFTTEKNWKAEADVLKKKIDDTKKEVNKYKAEVDVRTAQVGQTKQEFDQAKKTLDQQISDLNDRNRLREDETTKLRQQVEVAEQNTKASLEEAAHHKSETDKLRDLLAQVQDQANKYGLRQVELNDQIRILQRQLETATANNKYLRDSVAKLAGKLREANLPDDPDQITGPSTVPPQVEGEVKRVSARNDRVEITIGSDDGLKVGHELLVYRTKGIPAFLGKVRIEQVEPDQAVGVVVGKTVSGKKIQEGDIVSPTIRSR